jgi:hypothetical protein
LRHLAGLLCGSADATGRRIHGDHPGRLAAGGIATICNVAQQLTAQQERALDLLCTGFAETAVAETLGVNRTTVWRWRNENSLFQAELNRRRHEAWMASIERLRGIVPTALEALEEELAGPRRLRAAALVLELAGFHASRKTSIDVQPSGPTTQSGVERAREESRAMEELMGSLLLVGN